MLQQEVGSRTLKIRDLQNYLKPGSSTEGRLTFIIGNSISVKLVRHFAPNQWSQPICYALWLSLSSCRPSQLSNEIARDRNECLILSRENPRIMNFHAFPLKKRFLFPILYFSTSWDRNVLSLPILKNWITYNWKNVETLWM